MNRIVQDCGWKEEFEQYKKIWLDKFEENLKQEKLKKQQEDKKEEDKKEEDKKEEEKK